MAKLTLNTIQKPDPIKVKDLNIGQLATIVNHKIKGYNGLIIARTADTIISLNHFKFTWNVENTTFECLPFASGESVTLTQE